MEKIQGQFIRKLLIKVLKNMQNCTNSMLKNQNVVLKFLLGGMGRSLI